MTPLDLNSFNHFISTVAVVAVTDIQDRDWVFYFYRIIIININEHQHGS